MLLLRRIGSHLPGPHYARRWLSRLSSGPLLHSQRLGPASKTLVQPGGRSTLETLVAQSTSREMLVGPFTEASSPSIEQQVHHLRDPQAYKQPRRREGFSSSAVAASRPQTSLTRQHPQRPSGNANPLLLYGLLKIYFDLKDCDKRLGPEKNHDKAEMICPICSLKFL